MCCTQNRFKTPFCMLWCDSCCLKIGLRIGYLDLVLLNTILAVCRLESGEQIPAWAMEGEFMSVTRTADELSVVCRASAVPADTECETGWRIFKVEGVLDFALTGVLCSVVKPLAEAGVSIFSLSTYNSDYVMVKEEKH